MEKPDVSEQELKTVDELKESRKYYLDLKKDCQYKYEYYKGASELMYLWAMVLFGLLYPVRGIYFLIKWAIRTLKE